MAPLDTGLNGNVRNAGKPAWEDSAHIQLEQTAGFEVLRLAGDMRLWGRQEEKSRLLDTFHSTLPDSSALIFNLRGVTHVDTMGISFMVELLNSCIARGIVIQTVLPPGVAGQALRLVRIFGGCSELTDELAAVQDARQIAASNSRPQARDKTNGSKQETVMSIPSGPIALLVHDQSQDMEQLKKILQDLNARLEEVRTIAAAIVRLGEASPPDVIFIHLRLAGDALRLVGLARENTNSTTVIAVSPLLAGSACGLALDYGAFGRLAPPLDRSQVEVLLQQAVQQTMVWRQQHLAELLKELQMCVQALGHGESGSGAGIDVGLNLGMN